MYFHSTYTEITSHDKGKVLDPKDLPRLFYPLIDTANALNVMKEEFDSDTVHQQFVEHKEQKEGKLPNYTEWGLQLLDDDTE